VGARALLAAAVLAASMLAGCSHPPPDSTPDGVVRLFLDDIEGASSDPRLMHAAYDLLGPAAKANLAERARRATFLPGQTVQPWDVLVGFGLAFRAKAVRAAVVGSRATVEVYGADPQNEHASITCVKQGAVWRIEPALPPP
jgi:outer membrane murein-binding lipoprotein Lpp